MMKLGIEDEAEVEIKYDMRGEVLYSDSMATTSPDAKMAPAVRKECTEFDKLMAEYKHLVERKTSILQL